ncbi:MAG: Holliday junction branch migration protein RuvA [Lachnospiraceae bacterium]|nr:Holliday junction branch migration protein RuvA [Lachnospiraceae bacterium]
MYAYIEGIVAEIGEKTAVIDNHEIGYEIFMPLTSLQKLVHNETVKVYTYYQSNDNGTALFGFLSKEEKRIFTLLISVSGVGPKGAISILSVLSAEDLTYAIIGENVKAITAAPGIGTKAAQKIIVELRDKLDLEDVVMESIGENATGTTSSQTSFGAMKNNVLLGLTALGFSNADAIKALNEVEVNEDMTEETLLKEALNKLKR